ncbi:MAG: class I SAM-dependent methyltransferase [Planctomycetota bacterium]
MKTDHIHCPVRPRVELDNPEEPLEMIGFTIARYKFACKWMRTTDRVLEAGCGEGFGCNFFSRHVAWATGLDLDPEVIQRCRERYSRANLRFEVGDILTPAGLQEAHYDAVVSFEVIEHVDREAGERMVANCAALLKPGGLFILSTPRAREDRSLSRQVHHVFEYDHATFLETLEPHFQRVMLFCQNDEVIYAGHPSTAWNFIGVCLK